MKSLYKVIPVRTLLMASFMICAVVLPAPAPGHAADLPVIDDGMVSKIAAGPGEYVETPVEAALGDALHKYYIDWGIELTRDEKIEKVWNQLLPVFQKSFSRARYQIHPFELSDPDIFSVPGHIYVSTGMASVLSEAELAEVISHEFLHMIDSSVLKTWQMLRDYRILDKPPVNTLADLAAFMRGDREDPFVFPLTIEQTALTFSPEIAAEAGYQAKDLKTAWEKLRTDRSVEFENYLALHGLQGQMWNMTLAQLEAMSSVPEPEDVIDDDTNDGVGPEIGFSVDSYALLPDEFRSPDSKKAKMLTNLGVGVPFAVDESTGRVAAAKGSSMYWTVSAKDGQTLYNLDQRDNLSLQYYSLEFGPGGKVILTTQEDVILYDVASGTGKWLGVGGVSRLSPDGMKIAYADNGDLLVKDLSTGEASPVGGAGDNGTIATISWSPDSRYLLIYDPSEPNSFSIVDPFQRKKKTVDAGSRLAAAPEWTSEGIMIVRQKSEGDSLLLSAFDFNPSAQAVGKKYSKEIKITGGGSLQSISYSFSRRGSYAAMSLNTKGGPRIGVFDINTQVLNLYQLDDGVTAIADVKWMEAPGTVVVSVAKPVK